MFGACMARALDAEWTRQGRPDPFVVVEAGAGTGRLAREVLRAAPESASALHYVLVERSPALRDEQIRHLPIEPIADALGPATRSDEGETPEPVRGLGPIVSALDEFPARPFDGMIVANELLDNLPFDIVERTATGWSEVRVGMDDRGALTEVLVPAAPVLTDSITVGDVPVGTRLPVAAPAVEWIVESAASLRRGAIVLVDYIASWSELVARDGGWLRTYSGHARGRDPLDAPGSQDITIDVPREMLHRAARRAGLTIELETSQAEWLRGLGIDALVEAGRSLWDAAAAAPDLEAIANRSRGTEAAALTDPHGLGAHTVLVLAKH